MELKKEDGIKICESYSIGILKDLKPLKGGLSNYNFELTTNKGNFIIRFSSKPQDKKELEKIKIQLKAIKFLAENNFDYDLTIPLKNNENEYIGEINKQSFWIYEKINGKTYDNPEKVDIKQLAQIVAKYHLIMDKMALGDIKSTFYDYGFIEEGLKEIKNTIRKKKKKNEIDFFVEKNLGHLEEGFKRISKIDFGKKFIIAHSDWCVFNFIFEKDKIKGLIDFDMFQIAPYIQDIAIAIKEHCVSLDGDWDKTKINLFFKEYERMRPIEKFDKYHIKDLIIRDSLGGVINFYFRKKKVDDNKRLFMLKWFIIPMNKFLEDIKKEDYY